MDLSGILSQHRFVRRQKLLHFSNGTDGHRGEGPFAQRGHGPMFHQEPSDMDNLQETRAKLPNLAFEEVGRQDTHYLRRNVLHQPIYCKLGE